MTQLQPIKDERSFKRDPQTGAVVNIDNKALTQYRRKKERNQRIENLEHEINHIKEDVNEIKNMLIGLVNK